MLKTGLYEQVLNEALVHALAEIPTDRKAFKTIESAEAPKILAQYVAGLVQRGLENLSDKDKSLADQIGLVNRIIGQIGASIGEPWPPECEVAAQAQLLRAVLREQSPLQMNVKSASDLPRPETSLAQSSLFTGTPKEPQLASELKKEILSADRIDWLVSFVKWSGLRLLRDELTIFANRGGRLRVITTSYIGATDLKAVEWLSALPHAQIKISYDSSNLSNPALSEGLEWNVKVTRQDQPETMAKVEATFETYWNDNRFVTFDGAKKEDRDRLETALQIARGQTQKEDGANPYIMDIHPFAYQQEILDNLAAERTIHGRWKNLVVAATGTGKTVIAALDFRRFRRARVGKTCRLLFVAHREELLQQGLYTFRSVLKDPNFGDVMAGGKTPDQCDHLFITVQTLNSRNLTGLLPADYYDYIVVDEFHHAAADTYQTLLGYFKPQILLGLTATPERMDGQSILKYFDDHTAAEIRLPEAIERGLLCPFQYFGVTDDSVDLRKVKWSRGRYDQRELARVYTLDDQVAKARAVAIAQKLLEYSTNLTDVKALGFCVSVEHAKFMAEQFNAMKIPSRALSGLSSAEERQEVPVLLKEGKIKSIFVVDLYNEGVDIPEVNQIIMLRPTQSAIVFTQQLGRGLRKAPGKDFVVILDFIANYKNNYLIPIALTGDSSYVKDNLRRDTFEGSHIIPGCSTINFDPVARDLIYRKIDEANFSDKNFLKEQYRLLKNKIGRIPTISDFREDGNIDIQRYIDAFGSYSNFLQKEEKNIPRLSENEKEMLVYISKSFSSGKRAEELQFLQDVLDYGKIAAEKKAAYTDKHTFLAESVKDNLSTAFAKSDDQKKKFRNCSIIDKVTGTVTDAFMYMLEDETFRNELREIVKDGLYKHETKYSNTYRDTPFVLFEKYTYEDACRLLCWKQNQTALNIGGYKYDARTRTLPVFINYEKDPDAIKYEDRFISPSLLIALSKKPRSPNSSDADHIYKRTEKDKNNRIYLFVRKNKDDKGSKEFYFLGEIQATGEPEPVVVGDKAAFEITYSLETPVRRDIYDYLISSL